MLPEIDFPEIFVGLVAPVGVDTQEVIRSTQHYFEHNGYSVLHIKVTDAFRELQRHIAPISPLTVSPYHKRIESFIAYGNQVRLAFKDDAILAVGATSLIAQSRRRNGREAGGHQFARKVYLISQFKRPEEVALMRQIYGPLFFQLSVYSRRDTRISNISKRIVSERQYGDLFDPEELARKLVARDEDEATDPHGQRVARIFHDADLIVNTEATNLSVSDQIERFGELLFGSNIISPIL